jgi:pimeloyl-ACP methyl ester carboxylesterase
MQGYRVTMTSSADIPVVLIHGWGGSFDSTWRKPGIDALLHDVGRRVIPFDLLGHGDQDKPHDPMAYASLDDWLLDNLPVEESVVDVVSFSLGALTTIRALIQSPSRFRRVVLAGIGDGVFEPSDPSTHERIIAGIDGIAPADDNIARLFGQYAHQKGNDAAALRAVMQRPAQSPITEDQLRNIHHHVLVVIGDKDFAAPASRLAATFPNGRLTVLKNVDHFATPESFPFIDAVLDFMTLNS